MSHENEPKTINDYIDVVKILKLKIIKQNKKIQQLQFKNKTFEDQLNGFTLRGEDMQISSRAMIELENQVNVKKQQRQIQINTLKGKVEVINLFVKGIQKLGITPEAVFRVADSGYKSVVQSDYFREILSKIKLGLSQKEISCLIFIFDEFCQGFITRDDYYNSLHAYKIGIQNNCHPYIQESILKLSHMLHTDKVNLTKFYEQMQAKSKSNVKDKKIVVELTVFEQQIKKYYTAKISQRQIIASFNAIDLQSVGYLQKRNFQYCIKSYINKLLSGIDQNQSKNTNPEWNNNQKSQLSAFMDGSRFSPAKPQKFIDSFNEPAKKNPNTNPYTPSQNTSISKFESQYKLSIYKIYQQLLTDELDNRMTLKTFKKHILQLNATIPCQLISKLYREIDSQVKGSLYFNELINFYLQNTSDNQMIFRIIGKYFHATDSDSEKFWFMFGFEPSSQISKNKFLEIMKKNFDSKDEKIWQNLWNNFDKGRGSCNMGSIIKTLKKYEQQ